jgi:NTE family protein
VRDFGLPDSLLNPTDDEIESLAKVHTRLARIEPVTQERLINWGYLITDTALRRWIDSSQPPGSLPYRRAGVGASVAGDGERSDP